MKCVFILGVDVRINTDGQVLLMDLTEDRLAIRMIIQMVIINLSIGEALVINENVWVAKGQWET